MIARSRPGSCSMAISPRLSASLMAARVLALPMLARSAIRATGRTHFPVALASSRMRPLHPCSRVRPPRAARQRSLQEIDGPTSHAGRAQSCSYLQPLDRKSRTPPAGQVIGTTKRSNLGCPKRTIKLDTGLLARKMSFSRRRLPPRHPC
jgi:hypothetical protein